MDVTADYPPVPETWTLTLTDDEMATLLDDLLSSRSATTYNRLYPRVNSEATWQRLRSRGGELAQRRV